MLVAEVHLALAELLPPHLEDVARLGRRDVDALARLLRRLSHAQRLLKLGRVVALVHGVPAESRGSVHKNYSELGTVYDSNLINL